jgi:hypothetical protein
MNCAQRTQAVGCDRLLMSDIRPQRRAVSALGPLRTSPSGKQWLSFNVREELLHGLTIGATVPVACAGVRETTEAVVRAGAARHVRHLAGRARGGRPRSQYAVATPRSARRCERTRTRHDGLAAAPIKGFVIRCGNPSILLLNLADRITFHVYLRLSIDRD